MINQSTLQEIVDLEARAKADAEKLKQLKAAVADAHKAGEGIEPGVLTVKVTPVESKSTSWKGIVERIKELHRELAGGITAMEKSADYTSLVAYIKVEVKPAPKSI